MQNIDERLPARRVLDLVTTETSSDLIVYDEKTSALHTLNNVTATVWRALDDSTTVPDVVSVTGLSEDVVRAAVTKLADADLLETPLDPGIRTNQSRRALLKKAGIAASIPVLISVTAPMAASAASTCGAPCVPGNFECLSAPFGCRLCSIFTNTCGGQVGTAAQEPEA